MKIEHVARDRPLTLKRYGEDENQAFVTESVRNIIQDVRQRGDEAVFAYTKTFDGADLTDLFVSADEVRSAYERVDCDVVTAIQKAAKNIREYHGHQQQKSWMMTREDGTMLGQKVTPLDSAGIYVPGGTAAYPSTILMDTIPALVAGVERIVMASPPDESGQLHPAVLVAAAELGIQTIVKAGGAQAIAVLAYGTESIEPVDKIVGPGNQFVAAAKREVYGHVDIDMIAGPSEIVVLADELARADYIAADLLSQAEHDVQASAILVTNSESLATQVSEQVERQLQGLPRETIARQAIADYGAIYVTDSIEQAVEVVNTLAPEHLEVLTEQPFEWLGSIKHAGAIFLGEYSAEAVGDYFAGTNHVLPTNGTARFSSPLSVDDFMKKSSVIHYSKKALVDNSQHITALARVEGFEAHARAVEIRKRKERDDDE